MDYVRDYINAVNCRGGVVTLDVYMNSNGKFCPIQIEALKAMGFGPSQP